MGPPLQRKTRKKRAPVKGAWLPICCLCIFVRRLNLHAADRDMSSLDERVTETVSDRQPFFFERYCGQHGGKSEPVRLYLLGFDSSLLAVNSRTSAVGSLLASTYYGSLLQSRNRTRSLFISASPLASQLLLVGETRLGTCYTGLVHYITPSHSRHLCFPHPRSTDCKPLPLPYPS